MFARGWSTLTFGVVARLVCEVALTGRVWVNGEMVECPDASLITDPDNTCSGIGTMLYSAERSGFI